MTRDDVTRMAREAGLKVGTNISGITLVGAPMEHGLAHLTIDELKRFAALVEQHLIQQGYRQCAKGQRTTQYCGMLQDAVLAEREACALVCDANAEACNNNSMLRDVLAGNAAAIRARSKP